MLKLNILFRLVFVLFSIWTFVWVFGKSKLDNIDKIVTRIIIMFGLIHIILLIFYCFKIDGYSNRMFGKYWYGFWIYPFTYFFLTQLLWVTKLRLSKIYRILLALWILLVINLENITIYLVDINRNYVK